MNDGELKAAAEAGDKLVPILRAGAGEALKALGFVAALMAAATLPILIEARGGALALDVRGALGAVASWISGLADGSSLRVSNGPTEWDFLALAPRFCWTTYLYMAVPGVVGLAGGFLLGLARAGSPLRRGAPGGGLAGMIFAVPEFIMTVLAQMATLAVFELTGYKPFTISHDSNSGLLLALPLFVMGVYPLAFAYRASRLSALRAAGSRYVEAASARGVGERSLRVRHIGSAALAALSAELPTLTAIMMASVFMVEYSFALPGATRWLFSVAFAGPRRGWYDSYQYDLAINILLCMTLVYAAVMATLKGAVVALREAVAHAP